MPDGSPWLILKLNTETEHKHKTQQTRGLHQELKRSPLHISNNDLVSTLISDLISKYFIMCRKLQSIFNQWLHAVSCNIEAGGLLHFTPTVFLAFQNQGRRQDNLWLTRLSLWVKSVGAYVCVCVCVCVCFCTCVCVYLHVFVCVCPCCVV